MAKDNGDDKVLVISDEVRQKFTMEIEVDKPRFDFSKVSYGWGKRWQRAISSTIKSGVLLGNDAKEDATKEQKQAVMVAKLEALETLDDQTEERDALICEVLVHVPRSWLMPSAPEAVDWSKVESLEYLKMSKFDALITELGEARNKPTGN